MKRLLFALALAMLVAGCGSTVRHTVSPEYAVLLPKKVAVLPLVWECRAAHEAESISLLFRKFSAEKLGMLDYATVSLDEVNAAGGPGWFDKLAPHEVATILNADSVLYIRVTDWDSDDFATYRSLKISAVFELHSAAGKRLWTAGFTTKESDFGFDREPMVLALHKAYETRVQRFVDAVFSTLPPGETRASQRKTYFQWLP